MSENSMDRPTSALPVWRSSWGLLAVTVIVGSLSILPFWDGLAQMWAWWSASPEDSYGIMMPPVAAFLMWQQKDRLERIPFDGSWWGISLVFLGGATLVVGELSAVLTIVQYAYVITLYGLVLSFLGRRAFRCIAVPLLMLAFMIPLPQFVLANLSTKLQLLSSQIGVFLIRLFGVSVFLEGNIIDLGGYKLMVAEACSGLRYLFPLMTLGFLMAYFYKGAMWKRAIVFLSSIPITVLMNSFRIGVIGVTVEHWGTQMAEGFLHEFQGWLLFMVSVALLLVEIALLNRIGHESGNWREVFGIEFPSPTPSGAVIRRRGIPQSFIVAVIVLLGFIVTGITLPRPAEVYPSRDSFAEFPMLMNDWHGRRDSLDGVYLDELKLDDYLLADFENSSGNLVNLYVAYYNSQRKGEAVHSPRSCLPGGGWQLREFGQRTLDGVKIDGQPLRVDRTLIELGNQRELVYYWFQQRGRIVTNEVSVKSYLFWDALTRHRTDGALVRLIVALPSASNEADADRRLTEFAGQIAPILTRYVPN